MQVVSSPTESLRHSPITNSPPYIHTGQCVFKSMLSVTLIYRVHTLVTDVALLLPHFLVIAVDDISVVLCISHAGLEPPKATLQQNILKMSSL